ncbi:MAG TPA: C45 family peptidase [Pantanalinema sp.]
MPAARPHNRRFLALALASFVAALSGCGDPIPNAPNGPRLEERTVLRTIPQKKGKLERLRGELVLTTEGSPYEQGFQHGYLLRDELRTFYREYYEGKLFAAFKPFPGFTYAWYARSLASAYTADERAEIKGLADGSGMSEDQILVMQAEAPWGPPASWLGLGVPLRPVFGSAAFVARGPATIGGATLVGASVSGLGYGQLHRFALIRVQHPSKGYAFVQPGFVGRVMDGGMAWNERGLSLAANDARMRWANASGVTAGLLTRRVAQSCATLDQAEALVRSLRPRAGQGLLLTMATREGARVLEVGQTVSDAWQGRDRIQVRPVPAAIAVTSAYHAEAFREVAGSDPDAAARESRLVGMLQGSFGRLDVSRAMEILSDRAVALDAAVPGLRLGPFTLAAPARVTTVLSAVRSLEAETLYLAQGRETLESPAQFEAFGLAELLSSTSSVPVPRLPGPPSATASPALAP